MDLQFSKQQIELFHLIFLRHLGERIDKNHFVLKGGCNLRFYFKSIRYSEDIDFDIKTVAKDTLKTQVTKLLASHTFHQVLQTRKIQISDISAPKQTDTTQRWKLKIRRLGSALDLPTKIEFSRRGIDQNFIYEAVDAEMRATYQLYPILCNHYALESAYIQKFNALIHRTETQARDIFDISHLLDMGVRSEVISGELRSNLDQAIENTMSISFEDYKSQVVVFLSPEYQQHYGTSLKWDQIQERLIQAFEGIRTNKKEKPKLR